MFQSPQWGSKSKAGDTTGDPSFTRFSPRNGEVILKVKSTDPTGTAARFSPRNGEVILKLIKLNLHSHN